ncbi:hypothetical protein L0V05_17670 [Tabrizicola sp. J26]|uniref:hypothetical protein n=1 Tax=Alitabrizicola rongguiensis TaxID=2909234 RepID=UPI001F1940F8|nr:hypothetical protein [Tabrizicola rongguiensis]MCF1710640.1 hypothetical protein [Tabrizicola rongguiensis]
MLDGTRLRNRQAAAGRRHSHACRWWNVGAKRLAAKVTSTTSVEAYAAIQEARGGSADTILVFKGGVEVPASKIVALRGG